MDKILEAIILIEDKTACLKYRMIKGMIESSHHRKLGTKDVFAIFEACRRIMLTSKVQYAEKLASYVYRTYGKLYSRLVRSFCTSEKVIFVLKNVHYDLDRRLLWLKDSLLFIEEDQEHLEKMSTLLQQCLSEIFWNVDVNKLDDCNIQDVYIYIADIYIVCPCLLPKGVWRMHIQLKFICLLANLDVLGKDERRVILAAVQPLVIELWSDANDKYYHPAAMEIMERTSLNSSDCSSAVSLVMHQIPGQSLQQSLDLFCKDMLKDDLRNLEFALKLFTEWLFNRSVEHKTIANWIQIFYQYLYENDGGDIPSRLTRTRLSLVLANVLVPSIGDGCLAVFTTMALSYRRSAAAFYDVIPILVEVFNAVSSLPQLANSKPNMKNLALITACLIEMFPDSGQIYTELLQAIENYIPELTIREIEVIINLYNWEKDPIREEFDKSKPLVKREAYQQFILKAVTTDNEEQAKDDAVLEKFQRNAELDIEVCVSDEEDCSSLNSDENEEIKNNSFLQRFMSDYSEITQALKGKYSQTSSSNCCHPNHKINHDRNIKRKFVDEYLGKVFTWQ